ncbi:LLM class flavin-dependent oxidoreductase [Methylocystis parvus]|uniref:LLM class flavin-dependent oxidoreductase n=1 Tax=Methylocystis parvus TaxID=134 RepID=A0A6B8MA13_9HYPH|nr:LLM class flavin-dependent oxidoreductase [Methylocystis parvus]QGM98133.1 LLM class flavin-dependent oxidoreductase [Methylocystis parvus]WBK01546.1 LLM class flavin-dependent oxidoreductase [Methylocystis parvus OBBP]
MKFGVFCTYENPDADFARAYSAQSKLIRRAEALGFDEAWVAEHHFDPDAASPSIFPLIGYLAGVTSRIRLGSAAALLAFRNPIQVAEDVATVDVLSGGRFDFGVAKGGPFALQNKHFDVEEKDSRAMTVEALELIDRLLNEETVSFQGNYYACDHVSIAPRPLQSPVPTYVATATPDAVAYAARRGFGIMGGSPFPIERIVQAVEAYREAGGPEADPRLILARFYFAARTRDKALAQAVPFIHRFSERMQGIFLARGEKGPVFDPSGLIERSLIGSFDEVRDKIAFLQERTGFRSVILKPASLDEDRNLGALDDFAEHIRPFVTQAPERQAAL